MSGLIFTGKVSAIHRYRSREKIMKNVETQICEIIPSICYRPATEIRFYNLSAGMLGKKKWARLADANPGREVRAHPGVLHYE